MRNLVVGLAGVAAFGAGLVLATGEACPPARILVCCRLILAGCVLCAVAVTDVIAPDDLP